MREIVYIVDYVTADRFALRTILVRAESHLDAHSVAVGTLADRGVTDVTTVHATPA